MKFCYNFSSENARLSQGVKIIANKDLRLNGEIKAQTLRVVSDSGEQLGIMSRSEALSKADELGLDLIEISPKADPPVAKIMDWGKYQYQLTKERQRNRKSAKSSEMKQMRIGLKISQNDLDVKLRKIRDFLNKGDRVKIQVIFRGREMAHQEVGRALMDRIIAALADDAVVDGKPQMAGRNLSIIVRSKK